MSSNMLTAATAVPSITESSVKAPSAKVTRNSGRPPKTSQEAILTCAIEILEQEPQAGVSLKRIAKTMNISPMSIYNYFATRDQLLQALTGRLLDELHLPTDIDAAWQVRIIGWANAMRSHFKRVPYLIELLVWEGNTSVAWLQRCLVINDVLHSAGLRNDALTQATLWVAQTVMSVIHAELFALVSMDSRNAAAIDAAYLPATQLQQLNVLRDFAQRAEYYDQTFQYTLQRMVNELAQQITQAHFIQTHID